MGEESDGSGDEKGKERRDKGRKTVQMLDLSQVRVRERDKSGKETGERVRREEGLEELL